MYPFFLFFVLRDSWGLPQMGIPELDGICIVDRMRLDACGLHPILSRGSRDRDILWFKDTELDVKRCCQQYQSACQSLCSYGLWELLVVVARLLDAKCSMMRESPLFETAVNTSSKDRQVGLLRLVKTSPSPLFDVVLHAEHSISPTNYARPSGCPTARPLWPAQKVRIDGPLWPPCTLPISCAVVSLQPPLLACPRGLSPRGRSSPAVFWFKH